MFVDEDTPLPVDPLRDAAFRLTAASPEYVGFWLTRHRQHERMNIRDLLLRLRIRFNKLHLLSLCSTPRPGHFDADVAAIATKYGADPTALAALIRREQARYSPPARTSLSPAPHDDPLPS